MSLIVVEGVDASGKSTLLENARLQIPKRYFVLMRHSCRPLALSDALQFMRSSFYASEMCGLDVIVDRHPLISEEIYGPIIRDGSLFDSHIDYSLLKERDHYLEHHVSRIIYCRPLKYVMLAHIEKHPQLEWVKERFGDLLKAYDDRMNELQRIGIKVVWYDWNSYKGTLEDLFFGMPGVHA